MKISKLLSVISLSLLMAVSVAMMASATQIQEPGYYYTYEKKWEYSLVAPGGSGAVLVYGYNTTFFNEDYCSSYSPFTTHTATVSNGPDVDSESGSPGTWSKDAQIRHTNSDVIWQLTFPA